MNDKLIQDIREVWAIEMDFNLSGDKLNAFTKWLKFDVDDGDFQLVVSGIRSNSDKKKAVKGIMDYVDEQRALTTRRSTSSDIAKVPCSLCDTIGLMHVILAHSAQKRRRAPFPNQRRPEPCKEVYCVPQPCYCANGDLHNTNAHWSYSPQQRRKIAELYGMPINRARDKQVTMMQMYDKMIRDPSHNPKTEDSSHGL